jgi:hypothetical protein
VLRKEWSREEAQRQQLRSDLLGALTENPAPTVVNVCATWRVFEPDLFPAESIKWRRDLLRRMSEKRPRKNEAPTREASSAWKEDQRVVG